LDCSNFGFAPSLRITAFADFQLMLKELFSSLHPGNIWNGLSLIVDYCNFIDFGDHFLSNTENLFDESKVSLQLCASA